VHSLARLNASMIKQTKPAAQIQAGSTCRLAQSGKIDFAAAEPLHLLTPGTLATFFLVAMAWATHLLVPS